MGLSIHFKGKLKKEADLSPLIEEVKDIAETYKWKYTILDEKFPKGAFGKEDYHPEDLYGIVFNPPGCDLVSLTFLSNGKSAGILGFQTFKDSESEKEREFIHWIAVKTQYAGIELHITLVKLLHHLDDKYFEDFEVIDEGEYWESGDEKQLAEIFERYTDLIDGFAAGLEHFPMEEGETMEAYFQRLMKWVKERK